MIDHRSVEIIMSLIFSMNCSESVWYRKICFQHFHSNNSLFLSMNSSDNFTHEHIASQHSRSKLALLLSKTSSGRYLCLKITSIKSFLFITKFVIFSVVPSIADACSPLDSFKISLEEESPIFLISKVSMYLFLQMYIFILNLI